MAGTPNRRMFHKLKISIDESEKEERIKEAKVYPFIDIWKLFYDDSGPDDVNSVENFYKYLHEEAKAIREAHYPENIKHHLSTYKNTPPSTGRIHTPSVRKKYSEVVERFFNAEDEYFAKYENDYNEYLAEEYVANKIEDDREKDIKLRELKDKYKDAIDSYKKCEEEYKYFEKYEATINFLDTLPKSVLANIIEFQKDCENRGIPEVFEKELENFLSQPEFAPEFMDKEGKTIENDHTFTLGADNDIANHTIKNVRGSGLNITLTSNGITLLTCGKNINENQLNALAEYCYKNNINIDDFGSLKETQVLDEDGKELGLIEEEFRKAIKENLSQEDKLEVNATEEKTQRNPNDSFFGEFLPKEKITKKEVPIIKLFGREIGKVETSTGLDMSKAEGAIAKINPSLHIVTEINFNSTLIKVYPSKEDESKDCERDDKGNIKQRTKLFAVRFDNNKSRATFYLGNKEKMTADIARVALDAYKAQGYKYFQFPPINSKEGFGKEGQAAFLKASVKTGMVILLKGADGRGCDIGGADLDAIIKEANDPSNFTGKTEEKIEYFMRWHEQLEKYVKNGHSKEDLSIPMGKFKQQALFANQLAYIGDIENKITERQKDENWTELDDICASVALNKVIKEIKDGDLRYNPLDPKASTIISNRFQTLLNDKKTRDEIVKAVDDNVKALSKGKDEHSRVSTAVNTVAKKYKEQFDNTKDELKVYGVELSWTVPSCGRKYSQDSSNSMKLNLSPQYRGY